MKKRYYLIEPIDIDGDKNPDGFLISQYRINKAGNRIFLKNKYITFDNLKKYKDKIAKMQKGGRVGKNPQQLPQQQLPPQYQQQYHPQYQQQYHPQYHPQYHQQYPQQYQQYPNNISVLTPEQYNQNLNARANNTQTNEMIFKDQTGFVNNFKNSAGSALGTGLVFSGLGWLNAGFAAMVFGE